MLKPIATATRDLVKLDGVWKFGIDSRLPEEPWLAALDTPLEAAVPASYNDLFTDPATVSYTHLTLPTNREV